MTFQLCPEMAERPQPRRLRLPAAERGTDTSLAWLSWHPKKADAVWTRREWTALCEHLHNGNDATRFVMGFRDADRCKKYVKSKKLTVARAISWSWQSISGTPKSRLAFVPYSTNDRQQSCWGGLDFDAHNGESRPGARTGLCGIPRAVECAGPGRDP